MTRLKSDRQGSVANPNSNLPWRASPRYSVSRKRLPYDTLPSPKPNAFSIAAPSNQCLIVLPPPSISAGVTRTSVPWSQAGTAPVTGTESTWTSSSRLRNPAAVVVGLTVVLMRFSSIVQIRRSRLEHVSTSVNLTPTSAIVLGLLELIGEGTPYDLKQAVGITVGHFWTFQHAQLYTETERLAKAGLLTEDREQGGRRRKRYSLTPEGRDALAHWRADVHDEVPELRDLGMLKLFLGADPQKLGQAQLAAHEAKLAEYYEIRKVDVGLEPRGPWIALEAGIQYEKQMIRFWKQLAEGD